MKESILSSKLFTFRKTYKAKHAPFNVGMIIDSTGTSVFFNLRMKRNIVQKQQLGKKVYEIRTSRELTRHKITHN